MTLAGGREMLAGASETSVILFGVGGVGSWCAEALIRSGIGHLTIVDSDAVDVSNINRQLPATTATVGRVKVEVMRERLLEINPHTEISAIRGRYNEATADSFGIRNYDFAIDAIDSLEDKAHLILHCTDPSTAPREAFFSSMGAALKLDPSRIAVAEFWKVNGCPLARALRTRFKKRGVFPRRKFQCVYSPERLSNRMDSAVPGTFVHTTAIFGLTLAGLVVEKLYSRKW